MKFYAKCFLGCMVIALATSMVFADLYSESIVTGGPGRDAPETSKAYLSEHGMRIEAGDETAMIVNYKEEKFYQLNLKDKTYTETKFEDFLKPQDEKDAQMLEQTQKMLDQMLDSMEVTKTEETQEINGFNCTKYMVSIMGSSSVYWVTKDVPEHEAMINIADKYKDHFKKSPVLRSFTTGFDMQKKIDGFPIKIVNKLMNMEIVQEVQKVETKALDKALFQAPEGFKKIEEDTKGETETTQEK